MVSEPPLDLDNVRMAAAAELAETGSVTEEKGGARVAEGVEPGPLDPGPAEGWLEDPLVEVRLVEMCSVLREKHRIAVAAACLRS